MHIVLRQTISSSVDHMLSHSTSKCKKFKKTEAISSLFQPQCEEPRQQQQKEKQKIHKYVERKQPTLEQ